MIYPHQELKDDFDISAYFYNPNIHPSSEHNQRLDSLKSYCLENKIDLITRDYDPHEYFAKIGSQTGPDQRCRHCYELRLSETARMAKENGFESISTTLLVSTYQQHELIKEIGITVADRAGLTFEYRDYREGFNYGRTMSKTLGMYQQSYCGCLFSEHDGYVRRRN